MTNQELFIDLYRKYIKRSGAEKLLDFLEKSDFFEAPASTRFHLSKEGGLVEHSLNVYYSLKDYLNRQRSKEIYLLDYSDETIAIVSLLHDLCKVNVYHKSFRNRKDDSGNWIRVPTYEFKDTLPYGHGEKSVFIISQFFKLTTEEAFAIRYHMGFSKTEESANVGRSFEMFPLALALSIADMEATFLLEKE